MLIDLLVFLSYLWCFDIVSLKQLLLISWWHEYLFNRWAMMLTISHPLKGFQECLRRILIIAPTPSKYSHRLAHVWYGWLFWSFLALLCMVNMHFFLPWENRRKLYGDLKIRILSDCKILVRACAYLISTNLGVKSGGKRWKVFALVFFFFRFFVSLRKVFLKWKEKRKKVCLFDVENLFWVCRYCLLCPVWDCVCGLLKLLLFFWRFIIE